MKHLVWIVFIVLAACSAPSENIAPATPSAPTASLANTVAPLAPTTETVPTPIESSPVVPQPASATNTPDLVSTLTANSTIMDVSFDGITCTLSGPAQLPIGSLVLRYTNTTGNLATPWIARNYPGKTWKDVVALQDAPGSDLEITDWIAILTYQHAITVNQTLSYRQYDLELPGEYHMIVEDGADHTWLCGPFMVGEPP